MNCYNTKKLLVPFLEGTLSAKETLAIEDHLKHCRGCQKERDLFVKSWDMLSAVSAPKISSDFNSRLMKKIDALKNNNVNRYWLQPKIDLQTIFRPLTPAGVFALSILVLFTSLSLHMYLQHDQKMAQNTSPRQEIVFSRREDTVIGEVINKKAVSKGLKENANTIDANNNTQESQMAAIDEEIIRNLDIYSNAELYQDYDFFDNLDIIENLSSTVL